MKKLLFTAAALGLAAGIATSASALELKVKGGYLVEGYSVSNSLGRFAPGSNVGGGGVALATTTNPLSAVSKTEGENDKWLMHKFTIDASLKVNDAVSIKSRVRLIDWSTVWGSQDDTSVGNGANFAVKRLWMVYKSGIGQWEIGRRPAGAWEGAFVNSATRADRIMWKSGKMFGKSFSSYAFYQKTTEGDAYSSTSDDQDSDYYEIYGAFKGFGKTSLGIGYKSDHTQDYPGGYTVELMRVKGYGKYPITDMLGLSFEFDVKSGTKDVNSMPAKSIDLVSQAFTVAADLNFGAASADLTYFYISGDDNGTTDNEVSAYDAAKGTGNDFEPLYILTGTQTGILNNDSGSTNAFGTAARTAGAHGFVAAADLQASDKLGFHAALGTAMAASAKAGYDDSYGYEVNLGGSYKLLDNLSYNLHFGYMATGDFFKMGDPMASTNDIALLYNNLNMSF